VLDVHAHSWVPQTTMVQLTARADLSRRVWELLQDRSDRFEHEELARSPHVYGERLHLAVGWKSPAA